MSVTSDEASIALTRFGLGGRPGELQRVEQDPRAWLAGQIDPNGAPQPQAADGSALPSGAARFQRLVAFREARKALGEDKEAVGAVRQALLGQDTEAEILSRAKLGAETDRPFAERWALFWTNHFTVSMRKGEELAALAPAFEREAIRPHVFGRFETLLLASSRHPAMLFYLDQPNSVGPASPAGERNHGGLNENLAREIMELHTLGADAGYTQADVTEFARALTGWSVGRPNAPDDVAGDFIFRPAAHEPGERRVLGKTYAEGGEDQGRAILADFAAKPQTADHLSRQIAQHFVADEPDPALVKQLADAFRRSGGDLAEVARALIAAPEAWAPEARKIRRPYEFVIAGYRAAGASPADAKRDVQGPLGALGEPPLSAPQPNGWSDVAADWAAPDAIIRRLQYARGFAGRAAPQGDPAEAARAALGGRLRPATVTAMSRAETRPEAFALLMMSPEFQRR